MDYFEERFGVEPSFWDDYAAYEKSGSLWVVSEEVSRREGFETAGIRALRRLRIGLKPTTYVLQFLGEELGSNVVDLDEEEFRRVVLNREVVSSDFSRGYVALRFRGEVVGCGLVSGEGLETQVPKSRAELLEGVFSLD